MIDFHTHILPKMDDGSKSPSESMEMLLREQKTGLSAVLLTPHFYASHEEPDSFLERREKAFSALNDEIGKTVSGDQIFPKLYLGSEVHYFNGLDQSEAAEKLLISGTRLLLIEMPGSWSGKMVDELISFKWRNIRPVIAHINRCEAFNNDRIIDTLNENGILIQLNTECFKNFWQRRRAVKLLRDGRAHFIGTDCHGIENRYPDMDEALELINKHGGDSCTDHLEKMSDIFMKGIM